MGYDSFLGCARFPNTKVTTDKNPWSVFEHLVHQLLQVLRQVVESTDFVSRQRDVQLLGVGQVQVLHDLKRVKKSNVILFSCFLQLGVLEIKPGKLASSRIG